MICDYSCGNEATEKCKHGWILCGACACTHVAEDGCACHPLRAGATGKKFDDGKRRFDLLQWDVIEQVVDVLQFGAARYGDDNWKQVEHHRRRYFSAALRHMIAWWEGEKNDKESGKHHLAHAIACLVFLVARDDEKE